MWGKWSVSYNWSLSGLVLGLHSPILSGLFIRPDALLVALAPFIHSFIDLRYIYWGSLGFRLWKSSVGSERSLSAFGVSPEVGAGS